MSITQKCVIFSSSKKPPDINSALGELQYELLLLIFSNSYSISISFGYFSNDIEPFSRVNTYIPKSPYFGCNNFLKIGIFSSPILFISSISIEKFALIIFFEESYVCIKFINRSVFFISILFNKYFFFNLILLLFFLLVEMI